MRRTRAVAVIVGIAAALAGCGGSLASPGDGAHRASTSATAAAAAPHPDLGPFAGYVWTGDVESDHADWTVPRLLPGSPQGEAATWIGAEAPGPTRGAPFVQVGVNEGNTGGASQPFYYAFYSTTELHFHPIHLFDVAPGDQVSATLRRRGAHWLIEFADRTAGRERQLSVAEGAGRQFNEAQYNQEDVTDARTGRPLPYPSLSPVRFTAVAVDGTTPTPNRLSSSWLTEADGYLAPAALHGGAFTLTRVQLTAAGLRFLHALSVQNDATIFTTTQVLRWTRGGSRRAAVDAARLFARLLRSTITALGDERLPPGAHADGSALRADTHALIAVLATIPAVAPDRSGSWAARFRRLAAMVSNDGQAVRRALRLPGLSATSAAV